MTHIALMLASGVSRIGTGFGAEGDPRQHQRGDRGRRSRRSEASFSFHSLLAPGITAPAVAYERPGGM